MKLSFRTVLNCLVLWPLFALGCATVQPQTKPDTQQTSPAGTPNAACDAKQSQLLKEGDQTAVEGSIEKHLAKNFPDHKVSWFMPEELYQKYVVKANAVNFGRCNDTGCYLFAAPTAFMQDKLQKSMQGGKHDAAALGQALGLPAKNFEGPLRLMTLDIGSPPLCVRLPVESDPGVWKCQSAADKDCFKPGGYTSGGVPEVMVINAKVAQTQVVEVP